MESEGLRRDLQRLSWTLDRIHECLKPQIFESSQPIPPDPLTRIADALEHIADVLDRRLPEG